MGNIHLSKEALAKLNNSDFDKGYAALLRRFDPNRSESSPKTEPKKSRGNDIKGDSVTDKATHTVKKISDEEWEKIKENANKVGNPLTYKETLEKIQKKNAMLKKYGVSNSKGQTKASGAKKKYKSITHREKSHKANEQRPLYNNQGKDYYDFAGEYTARSISFGYGRKKSKEWNGPILHGRDIYGKSGKSNPKQMRKELQKLIRNHYTGRK